MRSSSTLIILCLLLLVNGVLLSKDESSKSDGSQHNHHIVSLLDQSSIQSTLVKVFSIIQNARQPHRLSFHFLLFSAATNPDLENDEEILTLLSFERLLPFLFPQVHFEIRRWNRSYFFAKHLQNEGFEREIIFARFLLPAIFSHLPRFLYLDNDLVVNMDIAGVFQNSMNSQDFQHLARQIAKRDSSASSTVIAHAEGSAINQDRKRPSKSRLKQSSAKATMVPSYLKEKKASRKLLVDSPSLRQQEFPLLEGELASPSSSSFGRRRARADPSKDSAAIAMVFELHPFYLNYLKDHFNQSHPLYRSALRNVLKTYPILTAQHTSPFAATYSPSPLDKNSKAGTVGEGAKSKVGLFLNGGVILYNTLQWNQHNLTQKAMQIIQANTEHPIYSTSIGDQAVFYLLLFAFKYSHPMYSFLPAQYNMRRLPKKTMLLLEEKVQGIIHFAGITHGNAVALCKAPLHYRLLVSAVLPYYLSLVSSFLYLVHNQTSALSSNKNLSTGNEGDLLRRDSVFLIRDFAVCEEAIAQLQQHIMKENIAVNYDGGIGQFNWPPQRSSSNTVNQ